MSEVLRPPHHPSRHGLFRRREIAPVLATGIDPQSKIIERSLQAPFDTQPKPPKRHKKGLALGLAGLALIGGGVAVGPKLLRHEVEPVPSSTPTPTVQSESPKPSFTPEAVLPFTPEEKKMAQEVVKNIDHFFKEFDRNDLNIWAKKHIFSESPTASRGVNEWTYPLWGKNHTNTSSSEDNILSYRDGIQNLKAKPYLGPFWIIGDYQNVGWIEIVGKNLGTYKRGDESYIALGMMTHPQLTPQNINGNKIEKYVQFVKFQWKDHKGGGYSIHTRSGGKKSYAFGGSDSSIFKKTPSYFDLIKDQVNFPIGVSLGMTHAEANQYRHPIEFSNLGFEIYTLPLLGKNKEAGIALKTAEDKYGWIWLGPHDLSKIPQNAPGTSGVGLYDKALPIKS